VSMLSYMTRARYPGALPLVYSLHRPRLAGRPVADEGVIPVERSPELFSDLVLKTQDEHCRSTWKNYPPAYERLDDGPRNARLIRRLRRRLRRRIRASTLEVFHLSP
jgi:hypothetical protein